MNLDDLVYRTIDAKFEAVVRALKSATRTVSQYWLVPFSIDYPAVFLVFFLSAALSTTRSVNAKFHEREEAQIVLRL